MLLRERSFEKKRVTLASGRESDFFIDVKQTALTAEGHALVGELMFDALATLPGRIDGVAGVELGGCSLASAVSLVSFQRARPLPAFYVRKEAKDHGSKRLVEGDRALTKGLRVAILEDVVTTGGSTKKAIEKLVAFGAEVAGVVVLVDRLEGGAEALRDSGVARHGDLLARRLHVTSSSDEATPREARRPARAHVRRAARVRVCAAGGRRRLSPARLPHEPAAAARASADGLCQRRAIGSAFGERGDLGHRSRRGHRCGRARRHRSAAGGGSGHQRHAPARWNVLAVARREAHVSAGHALQPAAAASGRVPEHAVASQRVREEWRRRVVAEYTSAAIAQEISLWLTQIGASPDLVKRGLRVARDELAHAALSRRVVVAAGGDPSVAIDRAALALRRTPGAPLELDAARAVVSVLCLGETVAVRLFAEIRRGATVAPARAALDRILRDEVRHRDLGWLALGWLLSTPWRAPIVELLGVELPAMFASLLAGYAPLDVASIDIPRADRAWGLIAPARYGVVVMRSVERDHLSRFAALGVDALPAWRHALARRAR